MATYYFSTDGADTDNGTSSNTPWATHTKFNATSFSAGDIIKFRCGDNWTIPLDTNVPWPFLLDDSGSDSDNYITITCYDSDRGDDPIFGAPYDTDQEPYTRCLRLDGNWIIVEKIKFQTCWYAAIEFADTDMDYCIIRDCEMTDVGIGIFVKGTNHLIHDNYIHDLVMVVNTTTDVNDDDDYGATGVYVKGEDIEVCSNTFLNCRAPSFDYLYDGGCFEVFDGKLHQFLFHHNWVRDGCGVFELTQCASSDSKIYNNVFIGNLQFHSIHMDNCTVNNLLIENNTIVEDSTSDFIIATQLFGYAATSGVATSDMINYNNNIIWLGTGGMMQEIASASNSSFGHENNLYHLTDSDNIAIGFNINASEIEADPNFKDINSSDYTLKSTSLAINAGAHLGYTDDYDGNARPKGRAPDIGAYESYWRKAPHKP